MVLLKSAHTHTKSQILDSASSAYGSNRQCKSQGQVQHIGSPADEVRKCRSGTVGVRGHKLSGVPALFILLVLLLLLLFNG